MGSELPVWSQERERVVNSSVETQISVKMSVCWPFQLQSRCKYAFWHFCDTSGPGLEWGIAPEQGEFVLAWAGWTRGLEKMAGGQFGGWEGELEADWEAGQVQDRYGTSLADIGQILTPPHPTPGPQPDRPYPSHSDLHLQIELLCWAGWCMIWGKGSKIPLLHVVPKAAPHLCWIQTGQSACLDWQHQWGLHSESAILYSLTLWACSNYTDAWGIQLNSSAKRSRCT